MTTITKERIELFIKNPLENGLTRGEQMELARIALASLEAEPVAWMHSDNGLGIPAITRSKNIADSWLSKGWYVQPLYIAKPVPVTPDGWISCSDRMPDKLIPVMVMYEDGEMWSAMWNGNRWDDGTEYPDPHSVTHWREMPAAPKQEVKS